MRPKIAAFAVLLTLLAVAGAAHAGRPRPVTHEAAGHLTWTSPQVNPLALSPSGSLLLVANTTSNTLDAINTATNLRVAQIPVGLEPSSVAFEPGGLEAWVSNHVSDSISVIDTNAASASYLKVIETIQTLDAGGATLFDEPVGIAFKADGSRAYVALSSRNQIAVVDTTTYAVTGSLITVSASEPRAIAVRNNRLYVAAFEGNNQTELSLCTNVLDEDPQCTLNLNTIVSFALNPNLPGMDKNIVVDPEAPDRDLLVYDISGGANPSAPIKVTSGVGTLLYGLAVDSNDRVYITQTDARNAVNGSTGSRNLPSGDHSSVGRTDPNGDGDVNLEDLSNRMFTNEVAILNCSGGGGSCGVVSTVDLDGGTPAPGTALATPYGIAVSGDDDTIVGTAAGSSRLFTANSSGGSLVRMPVGSIPKGIALASDVGTGAPLVAYVLNSLANTVSVVNVTNPGAPTLTTTINVGNDPTPAAVRNGAIAFNSGFASTNGSFSCASCHPDGNTDQLLWRIGGECFIGGCIQREDEPRTTMPVRGLRDGVPLHWDGTLGDPFGAGNGAVGEGGAGGTDCTMGNQHACFRDLVNGSLSGVMCARTAANACNNTGPSGQPGALTNQEREDMATFLERVSYPPARSRNLDDAVTSAGLEGFEDFFMNKGGLAGDPDTCADSDAGCHELPLGTATNSETLNGFDAPTMRGLTDRFLQFSLGPTATEEIMADVSNGITVIVPVPALPPSMQWDPVNIGYREATTFGVAFPLFQPVYGSGPLDLFQMMEEASTGPSGATGRQVTLNSRTTNGALAAATTALLVDLEDADGRGVVNLRGSGLLGGAAVTISYKEALDIYQVGNLQLTRADLISNAQLGMVMATLTAHLRSGVSEDDPQPLIAPKGANCGAASTGTGDPGLPFGTTFEIESKYVTAVDRVFVDGALASAATLAIDAGDPVDCATSTGQIATDTLQVNLNTTPSNGMHLLQVQKLNGMLSNEMPFCVGTAGECND
jgi:YVTN family beta-propeller protein